MTNIALIVLDTLRKDAFDKHFDWLPGVRYENAWSTSHWTVPAHASLFTGKYASEVGVYAGAQELDYPSPVLAESLSEANYTTRAFSSNVNISKPFRFDRGFTEFEGSWRLNALEANVFDWDQFIVETQDQGPERYAKALYECFAKDCQTIPSLKRGIMLKLRDLGLGPRTKDDGATEALNYAKRTNFGDTEFLFMNLMEAHTPYTPPKEYQTVEPPELNGLRATLNGSPEDDPDCIRQAYDDCVRYLSDRYQAIYRELDADFDYIITLADHGEVLGEHSAWEHLCGLYPELTHIPLVISGPGFENESRDELVNLIDVYRTIADITEIDTLESRGQCLADLGQNIDRHQELLTEYHGLTPRHRTALSKDNIDTELINQYDQRLSGIVDDDAYAYQSPTSDGFEYAGESKLAEADTRLQKLLSGLQIRRSSADGHVSDAVEQQLEDLGYA